MVCEHQINQKYLYNGGVKTYIRKRCVSDSFSWLCPDWTAKRVVIKLSSLSTADPHSGENAMVSVAVVEPHIKG
jgi:hypothetical protein